MAHPNQSSLLTKIISFSKMQYLYGDVDVTNYRVIIQTAPDRPHIAIEQPTWDDLLYLCDTMMHNRSYPVPREEDLKTEVVVIGA